MTLESSTILGIDHGERRIGLAIKPAGSRMALPLAIIEVHRPEDALAQIRRVISERAVDIVVVGLPLHDDPTQAQRVKRFSRRLRQGIRGVRWKFVDESLTSEEAMLLARNAELSTSNRPLDDRAAALLIESYLLGTADEGG
ncbi:Holliday junction resolvase RuvX [Candidatus Sumerlaeota bacterium]|nr:Holliday junction resolvase RuvX [Candidatus Sumerlaeota bacterium]MBI3735444.1 Holliday junction resolvase RuvX [Candidatus Sumerlaeota bacterium]